MLYKTKQKIKKKREMMKAANTTQKTIKNPNISMSYEEIAKQLNLTVQEVKDAEASAIKKIRHPRVGKPIKDYLGLGSCDGEILGF